MIESVLNGYDTLAIFPTGYGKSLCYQLPALALDGVTLVVSPLISLMEDQVNSLINRGIPAAAIHSGISSHRQKSILTQVIEGDIKLLYVAPERLLMKSMLMVVRNVRVSLLAVDEAHCVVHWGRSFRPAYTRIGEFRSRFIPSTPILALTATAPPDVRRQIVASLGFRAKHKVVAVPVMRENISLQVHISPQWKKVVLERIKAAQGSVIYYVRSRKRTEELASWLSRHGVVAKAYHAGLPSHVRSSVQQEWMTGKVKVIVATTAFGMGVDKPDVRLIVHSDLPESLDDYFQEVGRGGRDGKPAVALFATDPEDVKRQVDAFKNSLPTPYKVNEALSVIYAVSKAHHNVLEGRVVIVDDDRLKELLERLNVSSRQFIKILEILQASGYIAWDGNVSTYGHIKIRVHPRDIYKLRVENPSLDRFLEVLTKLFPEAFQTRFPIQESVLAKALRVPVREVRYTLERLRNSGIVDYEPSRTGLAIFILKDKPTGTNEYVSAEFVSRYNRYALDRFRQMVRYIALKDYLRDCRMQFIVRYLGDPVESRCGKCDLCMYASYMKQKAYKLKEEIVSILKERPMSIIELADALNMQDIEELIRILKAMEAMGWLDIEGDMCMVR